MPQLFSKSDDTIFRTSLVVLVLLLSGFLGVILLIARSPYVTKQDMAVEQLVPFSHRHHVGDIGLDCRYCHQTVETSPRAGLPTTQVCMNCHRDLWNQAPMLAPVRESFRTGQPLVWNRVHDLPDYVYFNHSIHIHKGIGCYSCHGDISEMPLVRRVQPLTMEWCLACHRDPETHVRPSQFVFVTKPMEEIAQREGFELDRKQLAEEHKLHSKTNCTTCHR